jgi:hypothetical protein
MKAASRVVFYATLTILVTLFALCVVTQPARSQQPLNPYAATAHSWHLYAAVLDKNTGDVVIELPVVNPENHQPYVFDTPQGCIDQTLKIGPVPSKDENAVVFRCVRDDALPADPVK